MKRQRMVAVVNSKSGGRQGAQLLQVLQSVLGPESCFDLLSGGDWRERLEAQVGLRHSVRVLLCGGDGTISRAVGEFMEYVERLEQQEGKGGTARLLRGWAFAPIPIGTGNDFARALGWGANLPHPDEAFMRRVVAFVAESVPVPVDVWRVRVEALDALEDPDWLRCFGRQTHAEDDKAEKKGREETRSFSLLNYLSVGCDADVEHVFNSRRDAHPARFRSQDVNFLHHALFGAERFLFSPPRPLYKERLRLFVDGQPVPIPENIQSVLVMNIPSYGAGADPTGAGRRRKEGKKRATVPRVPREEKEEDDKAPISWESASSAHAVSEPEARAENELVARVDDGVLEVLALNSLMHFVWIKMGWQARRLAQGHSIRIELHGWRRGLYSTAAGVVRGGGGGDTEPIAAQCDGEAWMQEQGRALQIAPHAYPVQMVVGPFYRSAEEQPKPAPEREPVSEERSRQRVRGGPCARFQRPATRLYLQTGLLRAQERFRQGSGGREEEGKEEEKVHSRKNRWWCCGGSV
ncbi:hypothetical protein CDCA_CDCA04G1385 [Cyanidium caldarium]|uniref:Diacylglycerol kinase n=1 Tax=Cyanidium caldarium TaxID=2771 RepID=A0AAV9ITD6_CYACA|nr:hypothetical protein CDCA_CDCA04G1385 [Cyanidium caldarium]